MGAIELKSTNGSVTLVPEDGAGNVEVVVPRGGVGIGPKGDKGDIGSTGSTGATGTAGATGATGTAGTAGAKGDAGPAGPAGATGSTGATGAKGDAGTTGPAGATGSTGATGATGSTGSAGLQGIQGAKGDTGSAGLQGATGSAGLQGIQGAKGDQGLQGPKYIQLVAIEKETALADGVDIIGAIELPFTGQLVSLRAKTITGTCTVTVNKGGTSIGTINANTSGVNTSVSVAVTAFDDITFDVSSANGTGLTIILTGEV